ncbi:MAG: response regulator transcription factor [Brockia lithotrophica]|nr:response regulator transcription factor [Brockia lithotrophica]
MKEANHGEAGEGTGSARGKRQSDDFKSFEGRDVRFLIVDDEERIRRLLRMYLEREPYRVVIDEAQDGLEALRKALENDYDLIILDLMLPGMDGLEVAQHLRQKKRTPILMLTARGEEPDRILGFEVGADDYVVKPFSLREVIYRIRAILKRSLALPLAEEVTNRRKIGLPYLEIDHDARRVLVNGEEVHLTPKEYDLLYFLAVQPDKVFTREQLLREVWGYEYFGDLRTVDTHIKRLREKLGRVSPEAARLIVTVWGVGYKLEVPEE